MPKQISINYEQFMKEVSNNALKNKKMGILEANRIYAER